MRKVVWRDAGGPRWILSACLAVASMLAAGCGGGAGGGSAELFVEQFLYEGATGVPRNLPLTVVFNSAIDPSSVSVTAFSVEKKDGTAFAGRVVVRGNTITFEPTVLPGDRNDYDPPNHPPVNGFGFAPTTPYRLKILGGHPFGLRNRRGSMLAHSVNLSFATGDGFVREDPPEFPTLSDPLEVVFSPAPVVEGDPLDPDPARQPIVSPRLSWVSVKFREPMDPRTFDPLESFTVSNVTESPEPIPGLGEPIPGSVEWSPDGRTFYFLFPFSLGDNPGTEDPFEFEFALTDRLTDLAGNPLSADPGGTPLEGGALRLHFLSEDLPGEPSYRLLLETFDTRDHIDTEHDVTTARWEGNGLLVGGEILERSHEFRPNDSNFLLADPLRGEGSHFQMIYHKNGISTPEDGEVLTAMSWSPRSNYLFPATYRGVRMILGHYTGGLNVSLNPTYDDNYLGQSVKMFEGDYSVPSSLDSEWYPWPDFGAPFEYDPNKNLVFELDCPPGGDTYQIFRNLSTASLPRRRNIDLSGAEVAGNRNENTQYHTRFDFARVTTEAYSWFYDTETPSPRYLPPLIDVVPDRPGTKIEVRWQGAHDDGEGNPAEPWTAFVDDIAILRGYRHIRFKIVLTADPMSGLVPAVRSVAVVYEYR